MIREPDLRCGIFNSTPAYWILSCANVSMSFFRQQTAELTRQANCVAARGMRHKGKK